MINAALVPLSANRWTPFAFVIAVVGVDLTGADLHGQVRLTKDTPGAALIDMPATTDPTETGVRFMSVDTSGPVPTSYVRIQIVGSALGAAIPPAATRGEDLALAWDMIVTPPNRTPAKWLYGPFVVTAGVTQLAGEPLTDDPAPGSADAIAVVDGAALTVSLFGLDLLGPLIEAAKAASDGAIAAQGIVTAILSGLARAVPDYGDREAIPLNQRAYGLHIYVTAGARWFVWTKNGGVGPDQSGNVIDGWIGLNTQAELLNRGNHTGTQDQSTVNGLTDAIAGLSTGLISTAQGVVTAQNILQGQIDKLGAIEIDGFDVEALTNDASPPVVGRLDLRGSNTLLTVDFLWAGWKQRSNARRRRFARPDWTKPVGILAVGNSFEDPIRGSGSYVVKYGAALNLPVTTAAVISADSKQIYRVGAADLFLTLAGNATPAGNGSASVAITAINGAAPSAANPASFMETFDGDTGVAGNTITGMLAGVHGTCKTATNGSYNYTFIPDAGSPSTAVPPGSLFVPDYAQHMQTDDVVISGFQNTYYSPFTGQLGAPDYVNPTALAQVDAIVRATRGQRVQIMGLLPDATEPIGTQEYTGLLNYNAYMKSVYPDLYVVDGSGKDFLATVLAYPGGNAADVAAGITPRELRRDNGGGVKDNLHLDPASGDVVAANLLVAHRAIQSLPPALPVGAAITAVASGQDGIGNSLRGEAVAWVQLSELAQLLAAHS